MTVMDAENIGKRLHGSNILIFLLLALALCQAFILSGCGKSSSQNIEEGWGETQSLSVATDWAGIDFLSPDETFITNGGQKIELTTYRYRTGIVEALYTGDNYEVVFRKSGSLSGTDLSEDDKSYSNEWDTELNGTAIHCLGDGEGANAAYFDMGSEHYSITAHLGNGNAGFTEEDLLLFLKPVIKP